MNWCKGYSKLENGSKLCNNNFQSLRPRWDKADLLFYYFYTGQYLQSIDVPRVPLPCTVGCDCLNHRLAINNYHDSIVAALKAASNTCISKIPVHSLKPYWNE